MSGVGQTKFRPPSPQPYINPSLVTALAASAGIIIGSLAPWLTAIVFTLNGLDAGIWGITTLTLGALSAVAMTLAFFWGRSPMTLPRTVPLAWASTVAGACCLTVSAGIAFRILSLPRTKVMGIPVGASVGWGLWLLAVSAVVLCITASMTAMRNSAAIQLSAPLGHPMARWVRRWQIAAAVAAVVAGGVGGVCAIVGWSPTSDNTDKDTLTVPSSFPTLPFTLRDPAPAATTAEASPSSIPQETDDAAPTTTATLGSPDEIARFKASMDSFLDEYSQALKQIGQSMQARDFAGISTGCSALDTASGHLSALLPGPIPRISPQLQKASRALKGSIAQCWDISPLSSASDLNKLQTDTERVLKYLDFSHQ